MFHEVLRVGVRILSPGRWISSGLPGPQPPTRDPGSGGSVQGCQAQIADAIRRRQERMLSGMEGRPPLPWPCSGRDQARARGGPSPKSSRPRGRASPFSLFNSALLSRHSSSFAAPGASSRERRVGGEPAPGAQRWCRAGAPPSGPRSGRPRRLSRSQQAPACCPSGRINRGGQWSGGSGGLMVRVAFECVELDAVQLLKALPAALAREIVLHLGRVLLHVPVERRALSALVAADLAPARREPGGRPGGEVRGGGASRTGPGRGGAIR